MRVDIGLHHLADLVCVRFFHCKVTFPLFLWKEVTICSSHKRVDMCVPLLKGGYLHKLLGILLHERLTSSLPVY